MKNVLITGLIAAVVILSVISFGAVSLWQKQKIEAERLSANQSALLSDIKHYRIRDSLQAASIEIVTLKNREFGQHFASLNQLVKELNVKVKHLQAVSQSVTASTYSVNAKMKDSIIVVEPGEDLPRRMDTVQTFRFKTPYIRVEGLTDGSTFSGKIETYDTLIQFMHRIPKRFLFLRYGVKSIRQEIISKNPHTRIVYSEYIKLEK